MKLQEKKFILGGGNQPVAIRFSVQNNRQLIFVCLLNWLAADFKLTRNK